MSAVFALLNILSLLAQICSSTLAPRAYWGWSWSRYLSGSLSSPRRMPAGLMFLKLLALSLYDMTVTRGQA